MSEDKSKSVDTPEIMYIGSYNIAHIYNIISSDYRILCNQASLITSKNNNNNEENKFFNRKEWWNCYIFKCFHETHEMSKIINYVKQRSSMNSSKVS